MTNDKDEVSREVLRRLADFPKRGKSWFRREYDSLSPEARKVFNDHVNHIFWLKNLERYNKKLDPNRPEDKPYVKRWLTIGHNVMKETKGRKYWEQRASKNKEFKEIEKKDTDRLTKQIIRDSILTQKIRQKDKTFFARKDAKELRALIYERFNTFGVDLAEVARYIWRDLKAHNPERLLKTHEGLDTLLLLWQSSVCRPDDIKAREVADQIERVIFSGDKPPIPWGISKSRMDKGILGRGYNGKGFLGKVKNQYSIRASAIPIAALNFAKRLTKEHIIVARTTPEGFKGLRLILEQLSSRSYDKDKMIEAEKQLRRIYEALLPGSARFREKYRVSARFLERFGHGKPLHDFIKNELDIHGVEAAIRITEGISDTDLSKVARNPEGFKATLSLYKVLIKSDDKRAGEQALRILNTVGTLRGFEETKTALLDKRTFVFPIDFSGHFLDPFGSAAHITATITKDYYIRVKMPNQSRNLNEYTRILPIHVHSSKGYKIKPYAWVGIQYLEKGGKKEYVPALFLLNLSKESSSRMWENKATVFGLTLTFAPFLTTNILAAMGASSLLEVAGSGAVAAATRFKRAESLATRIWDSTLVRNILFSADKASVGAFLLNVATMESRGWIIKTFGDEGRIFCDVVSKVNSLAARFDNLKLLGTLTGKIVRAWKDCRVSKPLNQLSGADLKAAKELDEAVQRNYGTYREVHPTRTERSRTVQDRRVEAARIARRLETLHPVSQLKGKELRTAVEGRLEYLELDPKMDVWRTKRAITAKEIGNWVLSLPENTQRQFLLRLRSDATKKFVLRDAAHEIRINKDLRKLGIDQEHGDFTGPANKMEKRIAKPMSQDKTWDESPALRKAIDYHNARRHHRPKTPDDHLHMALDVIDALTDPLRLAKTPGNWGYRRKNPDDTPADILSFDELREYARDRYKKDPQIIEAFETILEWKEGHGSEELGRRLRREYHDWWAREGIEVASADTVDFRLRVHTEKEITQDKDQHKMRDSLGKRKFA